MLKYLDPKLIFNWCCIIATIRAIFGGVLFISGSIMGVYLVLTAAGIVLIADNVTKWIKRCQMKEGQ